MPPLLSSASLKNVNTGILVASNILLEMSVKWSLPLQPDKQERLVRLPKPFYGDMLLRAG